MSPSGCSDEDKTDYPPGFGLQVTPRTGTVLTVQRASRVDVTNDTWRSRAAPDVDARPRRAKSRPEDSDARVLKSKLDRRPELPTRLMVSRTVISNAR